MSPPAKPDDIDLLLVDGDNLLHEARGRRDDGGMRWLLPELVRWRPAGMRVVVALDGHPSPGEPSRGRAAQGVEHRYAGSRSADDLLIELLSAQPYLHRGRSAVVTGDLALSQRARRAGGLALTVGWLLTRLTHGPSAAGGGGASAGSRSVDARPASGRIGRSRHADPGPGTSSSDAQRTGSDSHSGGWRPGRGATRKRGNPRRSARRPHQG
jgi:hypothetical protein